MSLNNQTQENEIKKFNLKVKLIDGQKRHFKLKRKHGKVEALVKLRDENNRISETDAEAEDKVNKLIGQLHIEDKPSDEQFLKNVLSALSLNREQIDDMELEIKFGSGDEREIKI